MKTHSPLSTVTTETPAPDFSGRPGRISLEKIVALKGHGKLKIRPIRLDDEQALVAFHTNISEESVYLRYFEYLGLDRRTAHERLVTICMNTPTSYAVVVERPASASRPQAILAVGRLTTTAEPGVATFDTLIAEDTHAAALGKLVLGQLMKLAKAFGFTLLTGELLVADHDTLNLCRQLGFSLQTLPEDALVRVTYSL